MKKNRKLLMVGLGFGAMLTVASCGKLAQSLAPTENSPVAAIPTPIPATPVVEGVSGTLVLPSGVKVASARKMMLKGGVITETNLTVSSNGTFAIPFASIFSSGTYGVAFQVIDTEGNKYVASTGNVSITKYVNKSLGTMELSRVGRVSMKLTYYTEINSIGRGFWVHGKGYEYVYFSNFTSPSAQDSTVDLPKINVSFDLPVGTHTLGITAKGSLNGVEKPFGKITLNNITVSAGVTTNIGEVVTSANDQTI